MPLIACANIHYTIGTRVLLESVSFSIEPGERVGLVGRNGCGKTTFIKILAGRIQPDSGSVNVQRGARIGYLTQDPELDFSRTLRAEAASGLVEVLRLHDELEQIYHDMSLPENGEPELLERLMKKQSEVQHRIEELGGYAVDHKIDQVLHGLGFTDAQFGIPVGSLSGGQRGRLALAKLLLESPELLLLDEPTNHLDIAGCEWLEEFLVNDFKGAVLMISHDRRMLDNVVHRIQEVEQGRLIDYPGNYTAFTDIRKQRLLTQQRAYENQQSEWAKEEEFIRRFRAGQRAKEAQGRQSKLERQKELFRIERPMEIGAMRLQLPEAPRSGDHVVIVREASKAYAGRYKGEVQVEGDTGKKVLFQDLSFTISRGDRWAIIGPNGAGKTTLVRAMLGQTPVDSGTTRQGASLAIGYYEQLPPEADGDTRVYQYLQAIIRKENPAQIWSEQQARDLAGAFLFTGQDQDKRIGDLSGGERSRARLAGLLASARNLIILDEPTNHLDIPSCERLEQVLRSRDGKEGFAGTLILISHDRALIDAVCDHLIVMDGHGKAEVFVGSYSEYHRKQVELARAKAAEPAKAKKPNQPAPAKPAPKPTAKQPEKVAAGAAASSNGGSWNKPKAPAPQIKSPLSWMPSERLEKDIEKATKKLKAAEVVLADENVYRDQQKFRKAMAERDEIATELEQLEAEWLRRAEQA